MGDASLAWMIEEYQPDYVLSGHIHGQPYHPHGNFAERIGTTWCFNPGAPSVAQTEHANVPNHILLDTVAEHAVWHAKPMLGTETILHRISIC